MTDTELPEPINLDDLAAFLGPAPEDTEEEKEKKKNQATVIVELTYDRYDLGVTPTKDVFAVARNGPNVAQLVDGAFRDTLAATYYNEFGSAVTPGAIECAAAILRGEARTYDPTDLPIRTGRHTDGSIVVDLGDATGRAVQISNGTYQVVDRSPVLFLRKSLTNPLPAPAPAGDLADLDLLRDLLNVDDSAWRLIVGWLVATLVPNIPHPVLALFGPQGTGKSTAGKLLGLTVDPSSAPLRSAPRDEGQWATAAGSSWVAVIDNISKIDQWFSDALCKTVSGDAFLKRKLYTDSDVDVVQFQRCVVLTSIDAGALRGDLAERLLTVNLNRIDMSDRRLENDVVGQFHEHHPRISAALYALAAQVLDVLPSVQLAALPRMADFAKILAALDKVTGWSTVDDYLSAGTTTAADVIEGDPVGAAVRDFYLRHGEWSGTAGELLTEIAPEDRKPAWLPRSASALGKELKNLAEPFRQTGIVVEHRRTNARRTWHLYSVEKARDLASLASLASLPAPALGSEVTATRHGRDRGDSNASPLSRHTDAPVTPQPLQTKGSDASDASDANSPPSLSTALSSLCHGCDQNPVHELGDLCRPCLDDLDQAS